MRKQNWKVPGVEGAAPGGGAAGPGPTIVEVEVDY